MNDFWQNLSQRERVMLMVGGVIVAVCTLLMVIVKPLTNWNDDARRSALTAERNFELVRQAASRQPADTGSSSIDQETPVRVALSQSSAQFEVALTSYNPLPDGKVTANARDVKADQLFKWIGALERDYGIRVITADIARETEKPELVRAQLTLGRN